MTFDLRTIYAMTAAACVVLGMIQYAAYFTNRFGRWLAWWSASNILLGLGSFCIVLRGIAPDAITVQLGNTLTIAGCVMLPAAMRIFAHRSVSLRTCGLLIVVLSLPFILVYPQSDAALQRVAYGSVVCGLLDLTVAFEAYRLMRSERLQFAKLTVVLFCITAALYLCRAAFAAAGMFGSRGLFEDGESSHALMGLVAMLFLTLRSMVITLMAAERTAAQLEDAAYHDPLTGVLNRGGLARAFRASSSKSPALLLVDLDHFKQLNDSCGHSAGDDVLRAFAQAARDTVGPGDLLARHGGDEFVIVLHDISLEQAVMAAERLRLAFALSLSRIERDLPVRPTLSIGAALDATMPGNLEALLHKADQALYRRKREGRDGVDAYRDDQQAA
jgi:diguanylate cyclase (GGDEF)-like protein